MFRSLVSGRNITVVLVKIVCQRMPLRNDGTFLDARLKMGKLNEAWHVVTFMCAVFI
jgi:hypothetical protein